MTNNVAVAHDQFADVDINLYIAQKLCLIGQRHLIISSPDPVYTERELKKINNRLFKFVEHSEVRYLVCDSGTSISVLDEIFQNTSPKQQYDTINSIDKRLDSNNSVPSSIPSKQILILRGLERASLKFQVALLEIMRNHEFKARTAANKNPNDIFLIVSIIESIEGNEICLYKYLQDKFWFRQPHIIDYGKHNPTLLQNTLSSSVSSVTSSEELFTSVARERLRIDLKDHLKDIFESRAKLLKIAIIPEIKRYILDIIIFIRNHRIVMDGIPTRFIKEFEVLVRCLAVINNYKYITPIIVKLAARKFFPLKINICSYEDEASLNWGSDINLIKMMMKKWNADLIVEDVLTTVQAPI